MNLSEPQEIALFAAVLLVALWGTGSQRWPYEPGEQLPPLRPVRLVFRVAFCVALSLFLVLGLRLTNGN